MFCVYLDGHRWHMKFLWPPHSNFMWVFRLRFILYVRPHCGHMSGDGVDGVLVASCGFRNPYANPANEKETMLEYFSAPEIAPCARHVTGWSRTLAREEAGQDKHLEERRDKIDCMHDPTFGYLSFLFSHTRTLYYVPSVAHYAHYDIHVTLPKDNNEGHMKRTRDTVGVKDRLASRVKRETDNLLHKESHFSSVALNLFDYFIYI